jgi:hypothetical protein
MAEALKLPRGGKSYIAKLIGCSRKIIIKGIEEKKKPVEMISLKTT